MPNPTTAAEWVATVPLDCPHLEAREVYVCYECAAANLDAYASQQVEKVTQERDELRHLIETGASRGAEISPTIRRMFAAGSKAAAERDALQRRVEALVGALEQHSHSGLCAVMIGDDNGPLCAPCRKRVQEAALRGGGTG